MIQPTITAAQFQAVITRVTANSEKAQLKANEFFNEANNASANLPGFMQGWAEDGLNEARAKFNELMATIREWLDNGGLPDKLSAAAIRFSDEIQAKVSAQAPVFRTDAQHANSLLSDDTWKGDAANAYRQTLLPQSNALTGYAGTAAAVSAALNECAWAIMIFWVGVAGALAVLVGGLLAAVALSETVIGAIAAALAALATAAAAFAGALQYAQNTLSTNATIFRTQANDNSAYGERGFWPRAGRDLRSGIARP